MICKPIHVYLHTQTHKRANVNMCVYMFYMREDVVIFAASHGHKYQSILRQLYMKTYTQNILRQLGDEKVNQLIFSRSKLLSVYADMSVTCR